MSKFIQYADRNPPLIGVHPDMLTHADYEVERNKWVEGCTADIWQFFGSNRTQRPKCAAEFDRRTAELRAGIQERNAAQLNEVMGGANTTQLLLIAAVVAVGVIIYYI